MSRAGEVGKVRTMPGPGLLLLWGTSRIALLAGLTLLSDAGDGVMPLVFSWSREILGGMSPYHDVGVAYPPLAMFFFALVGIGEDDAGGYAARFVAALLLVDFAGLCLASRAEKKHNRRFAGAAYTLGVASAGPILLLWRYDLMPAVFHLAAGVLLFGGSRRLSWAALGVGIALKPYLLVAVPFWALWERGENTPDRGRRVAGGLLLAAAPSLVAGIAMLPFAGLDFLSAYTFQASRGLQIESGPAVVLAEAVAAGLTSGRPFFSRHCLCWERTGPMAGDVTVVAAVIGVAALVGLALAVAKGQNTRLVLTEKVIIASCAAVVVPFATYRVFSPQFLLWALAPAALCLGDRPRKLAFVLLAGAALTAAYLYPLNYDEVVNHSGAGRWLLVARITAVLFAYPLMIPLRSTGSSRVLRRIAISSR